MATESNWNTAAIYGSFNPAIRIGDILKSPGATEDAAGTIKNGGYMVSSRGAKTLYILEKIYNLKELGSLMNFQSASSAELVLELIEREGVSGCRKLNGKFTIILIENGNTTIIRDRHGESRMIYYTRDFFADSYKGLFGFKNFKPVPDLTGITTFLKIGYIPAPVTSLVGVSKIPAGEVLYHTKDGFRSEKLFGFDEILKTERKAIPAEEAIETYGELLKKSLRRRIDDAGTVGLLLSGGYDSGGNMAMTREVHPGKIKTYSIGFKDNPASELPYARMMAEQHGAEHHEYIMDGSEIEFLPEIIDTLGDPFSESGFMLNYAVMKMVSTEDLPITIGGDGNDQYFGTGVRETAMHYKMSKLGLAPFSRLFEKMAGNSMFDKDNLAYRVKFRNEKILKVMEPEVFGFHDFQLNKIFDLNRIKPHGYPKLAPVHFSSYEELYLQSNYYMHLQHSANEVILFKASRFAEAFNVNLAFSFMDLDIYHYIQQLPINLRAKGTVDEWVKGKGVAKFIHKQLVKPKLPLAVTNRPKQGGFSPLEIFFYSPERRKAIYSYIRNSAFAKNLKQNTFLEHFFEQYETLVTGKSYWFWYKQAKSNQLMNLLIISLWWDRVIENKKSATLSDYLK